MWFHWDNLTAAMIVSTVVLLLLVTRQRMVEVNIEQTSNLIVRTATDSFSIWLEDDLDTMGDLLDLDVEIPVISLSDSTIYAYEDGDTTGIDVTTEFIFTSNGGEYIKYQLANPTRRDVNGKDLVVFDFKRSTRIVADGPDYTENGGFPLPLSSFKVDFLDINGSVIANPLASAPGTIRNTRVRFAVVTPYDVSRSTIRELYYGSTLLLDYDE